MSPPCRAPGRGRSSERERVRGCAGSGARAAGGARPTPLPLDFDGSVISTGRWAEGIAVGFNRSKKGSRSYYPLFCPWPRPARSSACSPSRQRPRLPRCEGLPARLHPAVRAALPGIRRSPLDPAFFSDAIVTTLRGLGVEFTMSVPFEPSSGSGRGSRVAATVPNRRRGLLLRGPREAPQLAPPLPPRLAAHPAPPTLQTARPARSVPTRRRRLPLHHGPRRPDRQPPRGALPPRTGSPGGGLRRARGPGPARLVPTRILVGNQLFLLQAILTSTSTITPDTSRQPTAPPPPPAPLWRFTQLDTLRRTLIQRAATTRPRCLRSPSAPTPRPRRAVALCR